MALWHCRVDGKNILGVFTIPINVNKQADLTLNREGRDQIKAQKIMERINTESNLYLESQRATIEARNGHLS